MVTILPGRRRTRARRLPADVTYARVDLVEVDGEPSVMELELVEPELFLGHSPDAVDRFADHLLELHG
ncbi:hypothetical protein [Georgenia sp. SUBG003]|uniref:hypothetical protein n=1 Tax=Georgenia sp. SUBG003 TaxID=1497974 RepID=UPI0006950D0E